MGRIAAVGTGLFASAREIIGAQNHFVSCGLVESHFHLYKALIVDRCAPPKYRRTCSYMQDRDNAEKSGQPRSRIRTIARSQRQ